MTAPHRPVRARAPFAERAACTADLDIVNWFVTRARRSDLGSLEAMIEAVCRALGFRFYALVHHGDVTAHRPDRLWLTNYPSDWVAEFAERKLHRIDPVQRACQWAQIGFRWSRLSDYLDLRPEHYAVLKAARGHGLGSGFTVPIHVPGERAASCSFAVERGAAFPAGALLAAQLVGQLAFEAVRPPVMRRGGPGRLSTRQRETVALMAAGHTDGGIARRLGLSEETVTKYLNAARRRYGLARRTQLVAAALYDGEIGFDEVLCR